MPLLAHPCSARNHKPPILPWEELNSANFDQNRLNLTLNFCRFPAEMQGGTSKLHRPQHNKALQPTPSILLTTMSVYMSKYCSPHRSAGSLHRNVECTLPKESMVMRLPFHSTLQSEDAHGYFSYKSAGILTRVKGSVWITTSSRRLVADF